MKKNPFTLLALCAFLLLPNIGKATDYTIGSDDYDSQNTPLDTYNNYCLTQNLYLASELTTAGAEAGNITAVSFRVKSLAATKDRNIDVYITATNATQLTGFTNVTADNKVYSGNLSTKKITIPTSGWYTITLDDAFAWNGTSNILVTIDDNSDNWTSGHSSHDCLWSGAFGKNRTAYYLHNSTNPNPTSISVSATLQKYYPTIKFTIIAAAPAVPTTPSDLTVSSVNASSATLSWSSVSGATSYDLQQSANGSDWSTLSLGETGISYNWTGLSAESTQYARIRANNLIGSSDWSDAVIVTTDAVHEHNGISFDKWTSTNSLPSEAGNYYLNSDVTLVGNYSLSENINLCLNGHDINTYAYNITVPNSKTLAIYDNEGGGSISGYYESAPLSPAGLISIEEGGTLIIGEGAVQNLNVDPNEGYLAYAIYNKGTLRISGAPEITAATADISLFNNKYITLDGALTNTTKYSVNAGGQTITSGWSTYMNGEKPSDYFESAKSGYDGICVVDNEAKLVKLLALDEDDDNDAISDGTYSGAICVSMTRSLSSSQYNTFCLPFALSAAQMEEYFGAGYDLEEFVSSSLEDDLLSLTFNKVTTGLVAGKPYLLQPAVDVENPVFEGVTIGAVSPADQTSDTYISFHGTYRPTELEGGNKNLLFLGAGNELFYPSTTANIYGFRAYFEVKGAAQKNGIRARIVKKEDMATGFETVSGEGLPVTGKKILRNGQILIIRDGKTYNAQGQLVK